MADPATLHAPTSGRGRETKVPDGATGALVLADGHIAWGRGFGAVGSAVGELCFNTAMTGYQEVMTDPSYASQIVTFTFPHIGNVGVNDEDNESCVPGAVGCVVREDITDPSNFRAKPGDEGHFSAWLAARGQIGLAGLDTRALTRRIRLGGAPKVVIAHHPHGHFDLPSLVDQARDWAGLENMDLARVVSRSGNEVWHGDVWGLGKGYKLSSEAPASDHHPHIVALDFGAKDNIFRRLAHAGARVTIMPAQTSLDDLLAARPDGVFLSNGPGDPAATGVYAVPLIHALLERDFPIFGICLGHQLLALAAGARTIKMHQGHRGANHPVKRLADGVVEITSMNHGFAVDNSPGALPEGVVETHVSLFDGSNAGIAITGKRAFGVQYHPEASPGPMDSLYLFDNFLASLA